MAETGDLKRLEEQLYHYYPELRGDSEDLKLERRNRLFTQLHSNQPVIHLVALDAVSSLTSIKSLLEKCKDVVLDDSHNISSTPGTMSPTISLIESSGDEFLDTQRPRRARARKRRSTSIHYNCSEVNKLQYGRKDDSPLSLSILIPQVVKGSEKMEISIDLGELDTSQRLFASRVDELLRKRTNSSHMPEDATLKENLGSSKCKDFHLPIAASGTVEAIIEKQDDDVLSRLISQVLVENQEAETLQATNLLDNINNNERSNYDASVPDVVELPKEQLVKKKRQSKPKKSAVVDKGPPKKRGRKPKNKSDTHGGLESAEIPKSDLAKYVEIFSNSCNMAGPTTPAASSTVSQQLVTSTTHYLDSTDQQPITYYLEGDWENGGNCQLVQTDSTHVDGAQEEFNMAELVNYIDNVGDTGNAIARVLDGPATVPIPTQNTQSQSNLIVPPPAHVSDVLLDLSKKSTISYNLPAPVIMNVPTETANQDLMPLDLSLKSSKVIQTPILNPNESQLETNTSVEKFNETTEGVFEEHEYASFGAALDMPLIDLEDNINAFMQLTNNEVNRSGTGANNTSTDRALAIKATTNSTLPICDFEVGEILSESTICNNNNNYNHDIQTNDKINDLNPNVVNKVSNNYNHSSQQVTPNSKINYLNSGFICNIETEGNGNSLEQGRHDNDIPENTENLRNAKVDGHTAPIVAGEYERTPLSEATSLSLHSEATLSQDSDKGEYTDELTNAKEDNITNIEPKSADVAISNESKADESPTVRSVDHIDELHEDSGDLLFVDTESLLTNNLKSSYDGPVTISKLDAPAEYGTATASTVEPDIENNEVVANDMSEKDHSKGIDLIEDHQSNNVSVHLPISQLALIETNSEEFAYDYEMGHESSEEKDTTITAMPEKQQKLVAIHHHNEENEANESQKSDYCNDSGIGNSVVGDNVVIVPRSTMSLNNNNHSTVSNVVGEEAEEITTTSTGSDNQNTNVESCENDAETVKSFTEETEDLKQTSRREDNEKLNISADVSSEDPQDVCTEKIDAAFTHHTTQRQVIESAPDSVKVKGPDTISNLSVLEMELEMDDDCLDFEDEVEDDVLSLATSCFNSSDDERSPDTNRAFVAAANFKSDNSNGYKEHMLAVGMENENETFEDDKSAVVKVEETQCSNEVPNEVFKKFKIPKLSMTTATAKHGGPTAHVATAAALPMVILPTNALKKSPIKTGPDVIKPVYLEKITRTVQNVCAVTPLTLQQPTYHQSQTAVINQNSFNTVKPLLRHVVTLPAISNEEDVKDFKAVDDNKQIGCRLNEFAGIGGEGRRSSAHTIGIANTFGVTCLPFLVNRCSELGNCNFSHTLREPEAVGNILLTFSELDLNIAYKFAYNHELLFRRYMHEFCRVYSVRNNRVKLLNMVRDCERYPNGGKLLITIFHSLEYCGLNKVNACRQILNYSQDRAQETIDVLLEIILEADWTMFCDHIEKIVNITGYKFRLNVLHQMAPIILNANDQQLTSLFFKCLVNLDSNDVGLVQTSPILMQLLELIKNGQICR